jgi:hypothetical protein
VMAADRPYDKFYDFYSVSLETFGSTHVCDKVHLILKAAHLKNMCIQQKYTLCAFVTCYVCILAHTKVQQKSNYILVCESCVQSPHI